MASAFWSKAKRFAGSLPFVTDAAALWFCMRDPQTPLWVRVQISGALAYFVSPIDLVPDFMPILGFVDDASVIATTLGIVATHVTDGHRAKAAAFFEAGHPPVRSPAFS